MEVACGPQTMTIDAGLQLLLHQPRPLKIRGWELEKRPRVHDERTIVSVSLMMTLRPGNLISTVPWPWLD